MEPDSLNEVCRRYICINKNEETLLTWHNYVLAVRADKSIHFFDFSYNILCLDKKIDMVERSITCHKSSPAMKLFTSKFLQREMKNIDVTEMIIDPSFWPHNAQLTQEMVNALAMEWSPTDFVNNNESILAILNDVGGIEFYALRQNTWKSMYDFSQAITKYFDKVMNPKTNFKDLREAVYIVEPSSMCWAPHLNPNKSCYFVTAQKNCDIIFWCVSCTEINVKAKVVNKTPSELSEIVSMIWIPKLNEHFLLVCTDILGQIKAFECKIKNDKITHVKSHTLWSHKDKMIVQHLHYTVIGDEIVIVCIKYRHLLVQMLDDNCNILSQFLENINDYRITCITNTKDGFYLGTVNCKMYKINIEAMDKSLKVSIDLIKMKDIFPTHELYSISFSNNNMFCAIGMIDRKIYCRKENQKLDIIIFSMETKVNSIMPTLLNNPTKKLTNVWDYIEMLRYKTMKLKALPEFDYHHLYAEAETDIYKLRVYLIIVTLYNSLTRLLKVGTTEILPELSIEKVKEQILAYQATTIMSNLKTVYQKNSPLNRSEKESLAGARAYLKFYCNKNNKQVDEYVTQELMAIKTESNYVCQCCEETIEGFSCSNGHLNIFCSLSFIPIQNDDYLVCKSCNATVRKQMYKKKAQCVFCDLHFRNVY